MINLKIIHDGELRQFRLEWEGNTARIDYNIKDNVFYLVHSEVPYALRGQGIGKILVEKTYEYIEEHDIKAVAVCSYIKAIVNRSNTIKNS